jgi:hypothetical protein
MLANDFLNTISIRESPSQERFSQVFRARCRVCEVRLSSATSPVPETALIQDPDVTQLFYSRSLSHSRRLYPAYPLHEGVHSFTWVIRPEHIFFRSRTLLSDI